MTEVIERLVQNKTKILLDEKNIKPYRQPRIEIKKYQKERYLSKNNQNVRRVKKLIKLREAARFEKNWILSDNFRHQIEMEGWMVEDTVHGQKVKKADE